MVMADKLGIRTVDRYPISHDFECAEFLLGKDGAETITGEVVRLDTLNSEKIIRAIKATLDLTKPFCKKPERVLIRLEVGKTFDEFVIGVYYENLEVPLGEYTVRTSQVVLVNGNACFVQDVTVQVGQIMLYTQQLEKSLGRIDETLQEAFEKVANAHGESVDTVSRLWHERIFDIMTSRAKITKGRKGSEQPCIVSVYDRKSIFNAGTREYSLLMAILTNSRNLKRGVFVDDLGEELYDTTGGYQKNKTLMSNVLRNINEKIRRDTGLRYDLIVRRGSKYILNKEITLV